MNKPKNKYTSLGASYRDERVRIFKRVLITFIVYCRILSYYRPYHQMEGHPRSFIVKEKRSRQSDALRTSKLKSRELHHVSFNSSQSIFIEKELWKLLITRSFITEKPVLTRSENYSSEKFECIEINQNLSALIEYPQNEDRFKFLCVLHV